MGPGSHLCLSFVLSDSKGAEKDPSRQGHSDSHRSLLAIKILVSNTPANGQGEHLVPSTSTGPSDPRPNFSFDSQSTPSLSLDAEWKILEEKRAFR